MAQTISEELHRINGGNGGSDIFLATYTVVPNETSTAFTATCDKTYEELYTAYTSGKWLQARCLIDEFGMDLRLTSYVHVVDNMNGNAFNFVGVGRLDYPVYLQVGSHAIGGAYADVIPLATA